MFSMCFGRPTLGGMPSPMLEILDRDARFAGLPVILLSGNGLTGLITPDIMVFGVGGCGLRAGGIGLLGNEARKV